MSSTPSYIPAKDAAFDAWADNFSALLTATPALFAQTSGTAATVANIVAIWNAAYALVTAPGTKTKSTVSAKNTARHNCAALLRPVAQQISLNPAVTSENKTAIGVNPRTNTPTPVTTPTTYPSLTITTALPLQHIIQYRDQLASPTSKAKPAGAVAMQLFAQPSATPISDPTLLAFIEVQTKSPFAVTWTSAALGKTAYYAARWQTRKGLVGPWSPIASFVVAG